MWKIITHYALEILQNEYLKNFDTYSLKTLKTAGHSLTEQHNPESISMVTDFRVRQDEPFRQPAVIQPQ